MKLPCLHFSSPAYFVQSVSDQYTFTELSSEEYWSREDQIWRMSNALKAQFQRHCFIQIPVMVNMMLNISVHNNTARQFLEFINAYLDRDTLTYIVGGKDFTRLARRSNSSKKA